MVKTSEVDNIANKNAGALFNSFIQSKTCGHTFSSFLELCQVINLNYPPCASTSSFTYEHLTFYPRFKKKLSSWKANALWAKLDKRFNGKEYYSSAKSSDSTAQKAGEDLKVLVVGAGPCGLRTAIELACLGSKVVVLEKRENFSRNNILHLWPFLITDLKNLGAKKIYGRFCAGSLDHISIRQLQLILLKIALILGVEIIFNVSFVDLMPPVWNEQDKDVEKGWTAEVKPSKHSIAKYEFDVVVGADGKRNTLKGFKRKEFRGKLAIGLTVNFINRNTTAEAKVEEISGVAYIFNQEFFKNLHNETGIDLENIVYYKGETHYFVMTAKKHSLLAKGVLKEDFDDTASLLSRANVDQEALTHYTKEAANFSTDNQLPNLEFAYNQYGQADVALFDFTCMYAAENAAMFREEKGCKLLACLVGDSLLEPFWPMGTGCARGFLASFDATWMIKQWSLKREEGLDCTAELEVLAERESIYRLLHQTSPATMMKKTAAYTIDPHSRYVNLNKKCVKPKQVLRYYVADRDVDVMGGQVVLEGGADADAVSLTGSNLTRKVSMVRSNKLLAWCQRITKVYDGVEVLDLSSSWRSGLPLCAIIHRFRPDLINWSELKSDEIEANNQLAFTVAEEQLGIPSVMTGKEMATCQEVDKLLMLTYLSQFYEIFKYETPTENVFSFESELKPPTTETSESPPKSPHKLSLTSPIGLLVRFTQHIKRRSTQKKHAQAKRKKSDGSSESDVTTPDDKLPVLQEVEEETEEKAEVPPVLKVGDVEVKLRHNSPSATVHQRASNRISALSNQLISQWQQNSPGSVTTPVKRQVNISDIPVSSSSNQCYFCSQRLHVFERMSAEGVFFHRNCFKCSHCGMTLRQGSYIFIEDTGAFFCHKSCVLEAETCPVVSPNTEAKSFDLQVDVEDSVGGERAPERIELENIRMSMINDPEELPEEDVARHNFVDDISAEDDQEDTISVSSCESDADVTDTDDDVIVGEVVSDALEKNDIKEKEVDSLEGADLDSDASLTVVTWLSNCSAAHSARLAQTDSVLNKDSDDSIDSLADISTDKDSFEISDISLADISTPSSEHSDISLADISTDEEYGKEDDKIIKSSSEEEDKTDAAKSVSEEIGQHTELQNQVFSQRSLSSASSKSSASDNACVTAVLTENNVVTSSQLEHMEVEAQVQSVKTDEVSEIRLFPSNLNQDGYSSESISLSSGSEMDEDGLLNLLEDKKESSAVFTEVTKTLKKELESKSTERVLPRLPLAGSVLIKASSTPPKTDTSETQSKLSEDPLNRLRPFQSFNGSMLAGYDRENSTEHAPEDRCPPFERKHSFDSLEHRLQLRLSARNQWLAEDSNFGKPLKRSQSDRRPKSFRLADLADKQTPSVAGTPTKKSFGGLTLPQSSLVPPTTAQSPVPSQTAVAWEEGSEINADDIRNIPNVSQTSGTSTNIGDHENKPQQVAKKRFLPPLPKVVTSPTDLENSQKAAHEEVKMREMIAKNKFERMKAKSLAKKNAISQQDNITEVDAVAVPKKTDSSKGPRVKRMLPVPNEKLAAVSLEEAVPQNKETSTIPVTKDAESKSSDATDESEKKKKLFLPVPPRKKLGKDKRNKSQEDNEELDKTTQGESEDLPTTSKKLSSESNSDESKMKPSRRKLPQINIRAKIKRRAEVAARRQAKLESQQRLHRAQTIQRSLEEVEVKQKGLETRGVQLENLLRSVEDETEESKLMQEWFKLVQEKNALLRYENELMINQRELQLEDDQSRLQRKLQTIMALDDKRKTAEQLAEEKQILQKMLEVVDQRDELRAILDEQKMKEQDENVKVETVILQKFNASKETAQDNR